MFSSEDAIFAVRQLMEKHREKHKGLHMVLIDLEKAYDRVPRQEVWRGMREKGVPEKYVMIVQDMYEGARTRVKSSVGITDIIPVGVGLHQGSSLSPYPFAMIMDVLARGKKKKTKKKKLYLTPNRQMYNASHYHKITAIYTHAHTWTHVHRHSS